MSTLAEKFLGFLQKKYAKDFKTFQDEEAAEERSARREQCRRFHQLTAERGKTLAPLESARTKAAAALAAEIKEQPERMLKLRTAASQADVACESAAINFDQQIGQLRRELITTAPVVVTDAVARLDERRRRVLALRTQQQQKTDSNSGRVVEFVDIRRWQTETLSALQTATVEIGALALADLDEAQIVAEIERVEKAIGKQLRRADGVKMVKHNENPANSDFDESGFASVEIA